MFILMCFHSFSFQGYSLSLFMFWGTENDATAASLPSLSACLPLEAAARYCSGASAPALCWGGFSSAAAAAESACPTAPVGNRLRKP